MYVCKVSSVERILHASCRVFFWLPSCQVELYFPVTSNRFIPVASRNSLSPPLCSCSDILEIPDQQSWLALEVTGSPQVGGEGGEAQTRV